MSDLIEVLQRIIMESLKASKLSDIAYGTVVSVSPVRIQLQTTMQAIPEAAIVLTSNVIAKTAPVQGGEGGIVVINEGLAAGDKVVMLRASGGQRYIVRSKVQ